MSYQIIDANHSHLDFITRVYNLYLGIATMYLTPRKTGYFKKVLDNLEENECLKILYHGGKIIGWSLIQRYSPKEGYRYACETSTYIDQPYLGKGHGSYFKKRIIAACGELGYKYIVARIISNNTVSIHYNLKLGYKMVGVQKGIGMIEGKKIDVSIMEYHIQ